MVGDHFDIWRSQCRDVLDALYARSGAAGLGVSLSAFERAVRRAVEGLQRAGVAPSEWAERLAAAHLEDLALAAGCLEGLAAPWERLVASHQQDLIRAGRAMAGDEGIELAQALLGDLFGVDDAGRQRRSPLEYFHGRAKLGTWLRTVLAQRHVDRWRSRRFDDPVDEHNAAFLDTSHRQAEGRLDQERFADAVQRAVDAALAAVEPVDRTRIALYYGQGLTLAEIGRLLREHESTVSRRLARSRRQIADAAREHLARVEGLSTAALERAVELLRERGSADLGTWLVEGDSDHREQVGGTS